MENNRPASRNRRRSILTTTSSGSVPVPSGNEMTEVNNNRRSSINSRNIKGSLDPGRHENRQIGYGTLNDKTEDSNHTTPSIFRSPSLEERLAQLGIDLSGGGGAGNSSNWKLSDTLNISSGGEAGGGGSGRSVNSSVGGMGGIGVGEKDLTVRKSARLSNDISKRISGISSSMDKYDRKVRNVQETMQTAYKNTVQDRKKLKTGNQSPGGMGDSSPDSGSLDLDLEADDFLQKCRDSLKKDLLSDFDNIPSFPVGPGGDNNNNGSESLPPSVSESSSPRKVFGLDATAILKSSSSEESDSSESSENDRRRTGAKSDEDTDESSSDDEEENPAAMKISIRPPNSTGKAAKSAALKRFEENIKSRPRQNHQQQDRQHIGGGRPPPGIRARKKQKNPVQDDLLPPRSLSPIMPSIPDKQFQTILERREERVSRHLTSMQNEIAQLNHKVEMDKKKASSSHQQQQRGIMPHSYQGRPMRLLKSQQDKNGGNELNSFVQSTGGQAGGWERKDHISFLKIFDIWRKHPNKLMEALKRDLPHKRSQEIASHIKWFERFEQLSSANRANVHQWSQDKRRENELIFQMGSASQRAKLEGDKRRQEHLRMIREQERDRSKEKLAQWKRTQAVRTATSATSSQAIPSVSLQNEAADSSTAFPLHPQHHHLNQQQYILQKRPHSTTIEPRQRSATTTNDGHVDIAGVRQHILEITAKVHALDNPKRDFRPPRPAADGRRIKSRPGGGEQEGMMEQTVRLGVSRSFTNVLAPHPPPAGSSMIFGTESNSNANASNRIKLPEIELEPPRTRPTSSSTIRPPSSSLRHQQQQRNKRLIAEFRDRDSILVEAKKKAVEIARDRRKSNLNQLTAEDIKRRIRSRVSDGSSSNSSFYNPTKQSELRKTLTHLERLEMLSKQDLNSVAGNNFDTGEGSKLRPPSVMMISNLPSKGIPSWRRSEVGVGNGDYYKK